MLQLVAKTSAIVVFCWLWSCTQISFIDSQSKNTTQSDAVFTGTDAVKAPVALDVATTEEREAAIAPKPIDTAQALGETIVSLGDPAETGFWLKTSLIRNERRGRVTDIASGKSVNVSLLPLEGQGSGSQISLSAMRALGLPLTSLSSVMVFQD